MKNQNLGIFFWSCNALHEILIREDVFYFIFFFRPVIFFVRMVVSRHITAHAWWV